MEPSFPQSQSRHAYQVPHAEAALLQEVVRFSKPHVKTGIPKLAPLPRVQQLHGFQEQRVFRLHRAHFLPQDRFQLRLILHDRVHDRGQLLQLALVVFLDARQVQLLLRGLLVVPVGLLVLHIQVLDLLQQRRVFALDLLVFGLDRHQLRAKLLQLLSGGRERGGLRVLLPLAFAWINHVDPSAVAVVGAVCCTCSFSRAGAEAVSRICHARIFSTTTCGALGGAGAACRPGGGGRPHPSRGRWFRRRRRGADAKAVARALFRYNFRPSCSASACWPILRKQKIALGRGGGGSHFVQTIVNGGRLFSRGRGGAKIRRRWRTDGWCDSSLLLQILEKVLDLGQLILLELEVRIPRCGWICCSEGPQGRLRAVDYFPPSAARRRSALTLELREQAIALLDELLQFPLEVHRNKMWILEHFE
mmetsp:Transcript_2170/g.5073  ORF Transcript_2170/g.5073 Transcript_2170/m.5073 type:complete len:419 (+) Transcript_2170:187-1443(+)